MDDPVVYRLPPPIRGFLADLRKDPELASLHDSWLAAFRELDLAADGNADLCAFEQALEWTCAQRRPVGERLDVLIKLGELKGRGRIKIDMRKFTGW